MWIQPAADREVRYRARTQRVEGEAFGRALRGQIAHRNSKRVLGAHALVAKRSQDQDARIAEPTREELHEVDRRFVRPVEIFKHHNRECVAFAELAFGRLALDQLTQERTKELVSRRLRRTQLEQLASELLGEVVQRPEWSRRKQAIGRGPQPAGIDQFGRECLEQRGFAAAGFGRDQHETPVAAFRVGREGGERRKS